MLLQMSHCNTFFLLTVVGIRKAGWGDCGFEVGESGRCWIERGDSVIDEFAKS